MAPKHCEALLMDYAAGSLDSAHALIVSAYLTLSPDGRRVVGECEVMGAALMEHLCDPVDVSPACLESLMEKLDALEEEGACDNASNPCGCAVECGLPLPAPLAKLFPSGQDLKWRTAFGGLHWVDVSIPDCTSTIRLVQCDPGTIMPHHAHRGSEITLILDGSIEDETGRYVRGDLFIMDAGSAHEQIADRDDGCLCFTVTTKPIRFSGWFTRFLNPFV